VADDLKILLVSPDLLSTSRLAALARPLPARMETLRSLDDEPRDGPFDLVLLDLQSLPGDAAVIVARAVKLVERQADATGRENSSRLAPTSTRSASPTP
jgi:hypothetical protein